MPPLDLLIFSFLYCSEINKQTKIIKIVATSCQILKIKCTKFDFRWGSAPVPAGGAHRPLAEFKEPMSNGRERLFLCIAYFNNVLSLDQTDRHVITTAHSWMEKARNLVSRFSAKSLKLLRPAARF